MHSFLHSKALEHGDRSAGGGLTFNHQPPFAPVADARAVWRSVGSLAQPVVRSPLWAAKQIAVERLEYIVTRTDIFSAL